MRFLALIPARYASTRFPGKPLADIGGKTMIQRVYERASAHFEWCYVATDDHRIESAVREFAGRVVITSPDHRSGTDRCAEALAKVSEIHGHFDVVINIQGDEPFLSDEHLCSIKGIFEKSPSTMIATLVKPFSADEDIMNPNLPKVVVSAQQEALYFSRSPIPFLRGEKQAEWQGKHVYFKHIGLYGYQSSLLDKITALPEGILEKAESLEQLRWLENGLKIKVAITNTESVSIDTPEDLERVLVKLEKNI